LKEIILAGINDVCVGYYEADTIFPEWVLKSPGCISLIESGGCDELFKTTIDRELVIK